MKKLLVISNYNGHKPSFLKGRIMRISGDIVHVQLESGRFFSFHKEDALADKMVCEGEELELVVNRSVQAVS